MDFRTQGPKLAELGSFYNNETAEDLERVAKSSKAEHLLSHLASQQAAKKLLLKNGWQLLGERYNQYHGPRYIEVFYKHQPEFQKTTLRPEAYSGSWNLDVNKNYAEPIRHPNCHFGCGFHLVRGAKTDVLTENVLKTNWACVVDLADADDKACIRLLEDAGWSRIGKSSLWHHLLSNKEASLAENGGPKGNHYSTYNYGVENPV